MSECEKMHGVKLPSGTSIQVSSKNDSERIRAAFKLIENITDGVAKKLASFVVNHKGEVLKDVVGNFMESMKSLEIPEMVEA
jgi:isocitrate dehydrogenase